MRASLSSPPAEEKPFVLLHTPLLRNRNGAQNGAVFDCAGALLRKKTALSTQIGTTFTLVVVRSSSNGLEQRRNQSSS